MRSTPRIPAAVLTAVLLAVAVPSASATAAATPTAMVASVRSFPVGTPRRDPLRESVSTTVDGRWGGIERLDIPVTSSPAPVPAPVRSASRNSWRAPASDGATTGGSGSDIALYAVRYVGAPYRYGGATPDGWDCSGFTSYVYRHFGVTLPHQSESQRAYGVEIPSESAAPGDLMWKPGHVGIYLGNGLMVHASTPRTGTLVTSAGYASFRYYRIAG